LDEFATGQRRHLREAILQEIGKSIEVGERRRRPL